MGLTGGSGADIGRKPRSSKLPGMRVSPGPSHPPSPLRTQHNKVVSDGRQPVSVLFSSTRVVEAPGHGWVESVPAPFRSAFILMYCVYCLYQSLVFPMRLGYIPTRNKKREAKVSYKTIPLPYSPNASPWCNLLFDLLFLPIACFRLPSLCAYVCYVYLLRHELNHYRSVVSFARQAPSLAHPTLLCVSYI